MWCRRCQQDVPALAGSEMLAVVCCARCGHPLGGAAGKSQPVLPPGSSGLQVPPELLDDLSDDAGPSLRPPWRLDDWRLEHDLKQARSLVKRVRALTGQSALSETPAEEPSAAADQPEYRPRRIVRRRRRPARQAAAASPLASLLLGLGLTGLVCGISLVVWSLVTGRNELWNVGLPIALVSQAVMICGVILQPESTPPARRERDDDEIVETIEEEAPRRRAA